MQEAITGHEEAHKSAMKCYKGCAGSLKDFISEEDPDGDDPGAGESDGVERAISALTDEVKALAAELKKSSAKEAPPSDEVDLENISAKDVAGLIAKAVGDKVNAMTGKI
jgi:hypothetical protein